MATKEELENENQVLVAEVKRLRVENADLRRQVEGLGDGNAYPKVKERSFAESEGERIDREQREAAEKKTDK